MSATDERFHSNLTYLSETAVSPTSELRCAIPPVPEGLAVDLTVTLPRGVAPSGDDSPRLAWTERDCRWIGTASLSSAPAVVRIPESGNRSAFRRRLLRWTGVSALCTVARVDRSRRAQAPEVHCTVIAPIMPEWMVQPYVNVPAVLQ